LDTLEDATEACTENITKIDGDNADDVANIYEDGGDNNAWKSFLDAVIINSDTGDLRIDNDKEEDDEDNISDIAEITPDYMNRGVIVDGDWIDFDEIFENFVGAVNNVSEKTSSRTDEPTNAADLVVTGLGILVIFPFIVVIF